MVMTRQTCHGDRVVYSSYKAFLSVKLTHTNLYAELINNTGRRKIIYRPMYIYTVIVKYEFRPRISL